MISQTENNTFEMKLLDLQKKFDEEKKSHGETIQKLLSSQVQAQTAEAKAAKAQEEIESLKTRAQQAQAHVEALEAQLAQMKVDAKPQVESQTPNPTFKSQIQNPKSQDIFKLLRLPSVALRHAFRVMPASDLFALSLSSRRVRIAAESIQRAAFVHVESAPNSSLKLSLEYLNGQKAPILILSARHQYLNPTRTYKIGGQDVDFRFTVGSVFNPPRIQCIDTQKQSVWTGIETILAELWGPRPLFVSLVASDLRLFPQTQREIARLGVPRPDGNQFSFNAEVFDVFFDGQVVETRVASISCKLYNHLRPDSKLLNVNEVGIWSARHFMAMHLMNFEGRHLTLYNPSIVTGEIVAFIGSWLKGLTHGNLETLYISLTDFQPDFVWNCFNEWSTRENELKQYVTTAEYSIDPDGSKGYYDCSEARDLRRVSDGRVASVKCTNNRFFFFVWPQRPAVAV